MEYLQPSNAAINVFPRGCAVPRDRSSRWSVPLQTIRLFLVSTLSGHLYIATTVRRSDSINLRWGSPVRSHRISGSVIGRQSRSETAVWVANSSVDAADSYFASTACSDNTLPRYNVNTFLNSATTRTFSLGSASS